MSVPFESPLVAQAVKNDPDALEFLRDMALVMHWFDDLIDKDRSVPDEETQEVLWRVLVTLPRNTFYRDNFNLLNPIVINAITNWRTANHLERGQAHDQTDVMTAFIIRSSYIDLATMAATIIGGPLWAAERGVALRHWAHGEGFERYQENLAAERAAREGK